MKRLLILLILMGGTIGLHAAVEAEAEFQEVALQAVEPNNTAEQVKRYQEYFEHQGFLPSSAFAAGSMARSNAEKIEGLLESQDLEKLSVLLAAYKAGMAKLIVFRVSDNDLGYENIAHQLIMNFDKERTLEAFLIADIFIGLENSRLQVNSAYISKSLQEKMDMKGYVPSFEELEQAAADSRPEQEEPTGRFAKLARKAQKAVTRKTQEQKNLETARKLYELRTTLLTQDLYGFDAAEPDEATDAYRRVIDNYLLMIGLYRSFRGDETHERAVVLKSRVDALLKLVSEDEGNLKQRVEITKPFQSYAKKKTKTDKDMMAISVLALEVLLKKYKRRFKKKIKKLTPVEGEDEAALQSAGPEAMAGKPTDEPAEDTAADEPTADEPEPAPVAVTDVTPVADTTPPPVEARVAKPIEVEAAVAEFADAAAAKPSVMKRVKRFFGRKPDAPAAEKAPATDAPEPEADAPDPEQPVPGAPTEEERAARLEAIRTTFGTDPTGSEVYRQLADLKGSEEYAQLIVHAQQNGYEQELNEFVRFIDTFLEKGTLDDDELALFIQKRSPLESQKEQINKAKPWFFQRDKKGRAQKIKAALIKLNSIYSLIYRRIKVGLQLVLSADEADHIAATVDKVLALADDIVSQDRRLLLHLKEIATTIWQKGVLRSLPELGSKIEGLTSLPIKEGLLFHAFGSLIDIKNDVESSELLGKVREALMVTFAEGERVDQLRTIYDKLVGEREEVELEVDTSRWKTAMTDRLAKYQVEDQKQLVFVDQRKRDAMVQQVAKVETTGAIDSWYQLTTDGLITFYDESLEAAWNTIHDREKKNNALRKENADLKRQLGKLKGEVTKLRTVEPAQALPVERTPERASEQKIRATGGNLFQRLWRNFWS